MKRCVACGSFFQEEECPNDHSWVEDYIPPEFKGPYQPAFELAGKMTTYTLDGEEYPALYISNSRVVVFGPGENGHVGVYTIE